MRIHGDSSLTYKLCTVCLCQKTYYNVFKLLYPIPAYSYCKHVNFISHCSVVTKKAK